MDIQAPPPGINASKQVLYPVDYPASLSVRWCLKTQNTCTFSTLHYVSSHTIIVFIHSNSVVDHPWTLTWPTAFLFPVAAHLQQRYLAHPGTMAGSLKKIKTKKRLVLGNKHSPRLSGLQIEFSRSVITAVIAGIGFNWNKKFTFRASWVFLFKEAFVSCITTGTNLETSGSQEPCVERLQHVTCGDTT